MTRWKVIVLSTGILAAVVVGGSYFTASAHATPLAVPSSVKLPPNKVQAIDKKEKEIAAAQNHSMAPKPDLTKPKPMGTLKQGPLGIVPADVGPVPFSGQQYTINNKWYDNTNGKFTAVYAGYETQDPKQGIVAVFEPENNLLHFYKTSALDGGVHIVRANGLVLTLTAVDGAMYTFNVATMSLSHQ